MFKIAAQEVIEQLDTQLTENLKPPIRIFEFGLPLILHGKAHSVLLTVTGEIQDCGVGTMNDDMVLLQVPLSKDSNEYVLVQVGGDELSGLTEDVVELASDDGSRYKAMGFTLSSAMDGVMPALSVILNRLRAGLHSPDEISMKLGLQIGGEAGIFFAKGTTKGTVEVTVTWSRQPGAHEGNGDATDDDDETV